MRVTISRVSTVANRGPETTPRLFDILFTAKRIGHSNTQCHSPMSFDTRYIPQILNIAFAANKMASNNLNLHLSWLLKEKPFIPLAPPPRAVPAPSSTQQTLPSSSQLFRTPSFEAPVTRLQEDALPASVSVRPNRTRGPRASASVQSTIVQQDTELQSQPPISSPVAIREKVRTEDMARLRAAPSSTSKPQLLSQVFAQN